MTSQRTILLFAQFTPSCLIPPVQRYEHNQRNRHWSRQCKRAFMNSQIATADCKRVESFPVLFSRMTLTLISNCRNLRSASPSLEKDGCAPQRNQFSNLPDVQTSSRHKSVPKKFTFHKRNAQWNDASIKSWRFAKRFTLFFGLGKSSSCVFTERFVSAEQRNGSYASWESKWSITPHIDFPISRHNTV